MSRRALPLFAAALMLLAPHSARADFTYNVTMNLGALTTNPSNTLTPYFLVWQLNNYNSAANSAQISNFVFHNVTPIASTSYIDDQANIHNSGGTVPVPIAGQPPSPTNVVNPNYQYYADYNNNTSLAISDTVFGSVTTAGIPGSPYDPPVPTVYIFEDPVAAANMNGAGFETTAAWQAITIDAADAFVSFQVTLTNNYNPNDAFADSFSFNIAYTDPLVNFPPFDNSSYVGSTNAGTLLTTIFDNPNIPNNSLVYVDITDSSNYTSVQVGIIDSSDPNQAAMVNAGLSSPLVTPEPGTMMMWGLTLGGLGGYFYRRRKLAEVPAVA